MLYIKQLSFICIFLLPPVFSLTCYECQERDVNLSAEWCSKPKRQRCNVSTSICLKYLHKEGKPGFPNHIINKCELRSYYTQNKINACERSIRRRNGALTITETCTCDTDLCNDASLNSMKMMQMEHVQPMATTELPNMQPAETTTTETLNPDEEEEEENEEEGDEAVESPESETKDEDDDGKKSNTGISNNVYDKMAISLLVIFSYNLMRL